MAPIAVGDVVPDNNLAFLDGKGYLKSVPLHSLIKRKRVIIFTMGGMIHPKCELMNVPEIMDRADELKEKGVEEIFCVIVDIPSTIKEFEETLPEHKHVKFLADYSASFTHKIGIAHDFREGGLGIWTRRLVLLVEDRKVKVANVESGAQVTLIGGKFAFYGGDLTVSVEDFLSKVEIHEGRQNPNNKPFGYRSRAPLADVPRPPKRSRIGKSRHPGISRYGRDSSKVRYFFRLLLSCADALIGPRGATINSIRQRSGAEVTIEESSRNPEEMSVEIYGKTSQVNLASDMVQDLVRQRDSSSRSQDLVRQRDSSSRSSKHSSLRHEIGPQE